MNKIVNRVEWVDTLKFLGMWAIYIGHFANEAGLLYHYVFTFHVPLFFFISGFFALKNPEKSLWENTKKRFFNILIPYFILSFISIIFMIIQKPNEPLAIQTLILYLNQAIKGIRNTLSYGQALWFLPCLFFIAFYYDLITKIFKNKWLVTLIAFLLHIFASTLFKNNPLQDPKLFLNYDSAVCYLIYYALGAVIYPYLLKLDLTNSRKPLKIIISIVFIVCSLINVVALGGQKWFIISYFYSFSGILFFIPYLADILVTLSILFVYIFIAKLLSVFPLLHKVGKESLLLCGGETIMKTFVPLLLSFIGLTLHFTSPVIYVTYSFFLLIASHYTFNLLLKKTMPFIFK